MLALQLATRSILQVEKWPEGCMAQHKLFKLCFFCLEMINKNLSQENMAHEMTRFPVIFPALHGILTATLVCLFLGAPDDKNIRTTVAEVVEKAKKSGKSHMHPQIFRVLEKFENTTELDVLSTSFLLA